MQETSGSIPGSRRSPGGRTGYPLQYSWASLVAQSVKNLSAMQETWVQSLDWEDPREKGMATMYYMATQYSCLENPQGQRSLVGYSPWDHKESDRTERLIAELSSDTKFQLYKVSPRDLLYSIVL